MGADESIEIYNKLISALRENKLDWIIDQVTEHIRLGKTVEKEIETLKEDPSEKMVVYTFGDHVPKFKKGPRATFPVTENYTPQEQLLLLIDAIEQALVNTNEMERNFVEFFEGDVGGWRQVDFYSEESDSVIVSVNKESIQAPFQHAERLRDLFVQLRSEVKQ